MVGRGSHCSCSAVIMRSPGPSMQRVPTGTACSRPLSSRFPRCGADLKLPIDERFGRSDGPSRCNHDARNPCSHQVCFVAFGPPSDVAVSCGVWSRVQRPTKEKESNPSQEVEIERRLIAMGYVPMTQSIPQCHSRFPRVVRVGSGLGFIPCDHRSRPEPNAGKNDNVERDQPSQPCSNSTGWLC